MKFPLATLCEHCYIHTELHTLYINVNYIFDTTKQPVLSIMSGTLNMS